MKPQIPTHIQSLPAYQGGKPIEEVKRDYGVAIIYKLASNESHLPPSQRVMAAMRHSLATVAQYPDGNGWNLKQALAKKHSIEISQITIGNGSSEIFDFMLRVFATTGDSIVVSEYAFIMYKLVAQSLGVRCIVAPALKYGHDLDAMLAAIDDSTRIVFVANPNNPTGTMIDRDDVHTFCHQVPEHIMIVIDEAYIDFEDDSDNSLPWISQLPNIVVSRTFSKAFALAGMRVGYAISSAAVAELMNRVRPPFNVTTPALAAATAACQEDAWLVNSVEQRHVGCQLLRSISAALELKTLGAHGNFVTIQLPENTTAGQVSHDLLEHGYITRDLTNYGMPAYLRVSLADNAVLNSFAVAFRSVLGR